MHDIMIIKQTKKTNKSKYRYLLKYKYNDHEYIFFDLGNILLLNHVLEDVEVFLIF